MNEQRYDYPFERTIAIEPPPLYAKLRSEEPVARVTMPTGHPAYLVTRYEDVRFVLSDPRFSVDQTRPGAPRLTEMVIESVMTSDPPRHTHLRRMVSREFTARRVQRMRPRIQEITDQLLDAVEAGGQPAELHAAFTAPLPLMVICDLLGVPLDDMEQLKDWADRTVSLSGQTPEEHAQARDSLLNFIDNLADAKQANPGEDLLSALINASQDDRLTRHELRSLVLILLLAGYEPVANQLSGSIVMLLRFPEVLRQLQDDPDLIESATEELLRYSPPGDGALFRITTEDVEIGGVLIPANSAVLASTQAANTDPRQFANADRLDLRRADNPHLGFGHGIHFCLGSALARAELQIGLGTLVRRFPGIRLAIPPEELRWSMPGSMLSGFAEIPVVW